VATGRFMKMAEMLIRYLYRAVSWFLLLALAKGGTTFPPLQRGDRGDLPFPANSVNFIKDGLCFNQHLPVVESEHQKSKLTKKEIARGIPQRRFILKMLTTIDLDN
jgi:hypothetical protein